MLATWQVAAQLSVSFYISPCCHAAPTSVHLQDILLVMTYAASFSILLVDKRDIIQCDQREMKEHLLGQSSIGGGEYSLLHDREALRVAGHQHPARLAMVIILTTSGCSCTLA